MSCAPIGGMPCATPVCVVQTFAAAIELRYATPLLPLHCLHLCV